MGNETGHDFLCHTASAVLVGLVSIIPETKDGLVEEVSCGLQCAAPKLQVWIFSKRLFVIFGTSREAGGDYREEEGEAVLCSPPVKRREGRCRWKRNRRM